MKPNKQPWFLTEPEKFLFGLKWLILFAISGLGGLYPLAAQFAPVVGVEGTTAIDKNDTRFVEWATGCTVQRGLQNIADSSLGYASAGQPQDALGQADIVTVSLGDGGIATLTFDKPIYNGPGYDFAVFENGFVTYDSVEAFLELGFVEVSSDGVHFFRFPDISDVQDTAQTGTFGSTDGGQLYDLAGKYIAGYGTPFDLEELTDTPGLDINNITYVRVIDVVGSIDSEYATYDSKGHIVNDPWPTPFPSCGFDLDAVGVLNAVGLTGIPEVSEQDLKIYPNPVQSGNQLHVVFGGGDASVFISDINGRLISQYEATGTQLLIPTNTLAPGVYFLQAKTISSGYNLRLIVQ